MALNRSFTVYKNRIALRLIGNDKREQQGKQYCLNIFMLLNHFDPLFPFQVFQAECSICCRTMESIRLIGIIGTQWVILRLYCITSQHGQTYF